MEHFNVNHLAVGQRYILVNMLVNLNMLVNVSLKLKILFLCVQQGRIYSPSRQSQQAGVQSGKTGSGGK